MSWLPVCDVTRLQPECGMPVLVGDHPVAVFRTREEELFAVSNVDPFFGAGVISRGIVGDREGEPTVASPLLKQVFALRTGQCLDEPEMTLPVYPVRNRQNVVEVAVP
ncbi:nitrite reductase small subunit NirD [Salinifilum aidingensis]